MMLADSFRHLNASPVLVRNVDTGTPRPRKHSMYVVPFVLRYLARFVRLGQKLAVPVPRRCGGSRYAQTSCAIPFL